MKANAKILGSNVSASAHVKVHCLPDSSHELYRDSLLRASPTLRDAADSLAGLNGTNLEHLVNFWHNTNTGADSAQWVDGSADNATSCSVSVVTPGMGSGWKLVSRLHNHPTNIPTGTCAAFPQGGYGTTYPSRADDSTEYVDNSRYGYDIPEYVVSTWGMQESIDPLVQEHNQYKNNSSNSCVFP